MKARVRFTIPEIEPGELAGATAVVVDVLRATSTIIAALAAGARGIYPTADTEEALRLAQSMGRDDTLLCGERRGARIEGYDLGNSPLDFTPEVVGDRRLVMNTTNGTRAFLAAEGADRVVAAAFVNVAAVARSVATVDDIVVICAGRDDAFSLEDAVCAGALLDALGGPESRELDDAGRAAYVLARHCAADADFLAGTAGGRALLEIGLGGDLEWCARRDSLDVVPEMRDRAVVRAEA
ncbi:MAG: 2-phosphosulfolactate phosphatase [Longimicrobiales bacterium]|nr:2-phosphosulfolactate phosphatase [Longimicrobiales bacterium]